jgi:hypothetical protein
MATAGRRMTIDEYALVRAQDNRFVAVDKLDQVEALVADDPRGARSE